jgi:hypothetical protein
MSRAFVKESESEWLGDVAPDVASLLRYLSHENNGLKLSEVRTFAEKESGRTIHEMSNGECYALDEDNRWQTIL